MIARKLDSDYTVTKRLVQKEVRNRMASLPVTRNQNFVRNFAFSNSGGGGFDGSGSGNTVITGKTTGVVYDPANAGTTYEQTRSKVQGKHGAYLIDNAGEDSINIVADVVNDPLWWLSV